jgi:hypothetical protein
LRLYRGLIITGSKFDAHVCRLEPWGVQLTELVLNCYARRQKILGICFGHQFLSWIFGGSSQRAPNGWEVGLKRIHLTAAFNRLLCRVGLPFDAVHILQFHQDQVLTVPSQAVLLASSSGCMVEAYSVDDNVLCFQGLIALSSRIFLHYNSLVLIFILLFSGNLPTLFMYLPALLLLILCVNDYKKVECKPFSRITMFLTGHPEYLPGYMSTRLSRNLGQSTLPPEIEREALASLTINSSDPLYAPQELHARSRIWFQQLISAFFTSAEWIIEIDDHKEQRGLHFETKEKD